MHLLTSDEITWIISGEKNLLIVPWLGISLERLPKKAQLSKSELLLLHTLACLLEVKNGPFGRSYRRLYPQLEDRLHVLEGGLGGLTETKSENLLLPLVLGGKHLTQRGNVIIIECLLELLLNGLLYFAGYLDGHVQIVINLEVEVHILSYEVRHEVRVVVLAQLSHLHLLHVTQVLGEFEINDVLADALVNLDRLNIDHFLGA